MSRIPPKIKQLAAVKAKVYHVLPVSQGGITYSLDVVFSENPKTSEHFLKALDASGKELWVSSVHYLLYDETLEGDVQDICYRKIL